MFSEAEQKVVDLIDESRDDIIRFLQKIVSYKTITPQDEPSQDEDRSDYRKLAAYFSEYLDGLGFDLAALDEASARPVHFGAVAGTAHLGARVCVRPRRLAV